MRRNRTAKQTDIDELLQGICRVDPHAEPTLPAALQASTMTGNVMIASIEKMCQGIGGGQDFSSCYVELRGDSLSIVPPKGAKKAAAVMQFKHVMFASKVAPPSPSIYRQSAELRAIATTLMAHQYVAVYTSDLTCYWIQFEPNSPEIMKWQQAFKAAVQKRDKLEASWASRQAAYDKLVPLVWQQIIIQLEQLQHMMKMFARIDMTGEFEEDQAKDDKLVGWLSVRTGEDEGEGEEWTDRYCVIRKNLFLIFKNENTMENAPVEMICLQFANIWANTDWTQAFNMTTPVQSLVLRAPNEAALETWTNGIFALQCSDSFHHLVPQGMGKQHLLRRLRGRGGEMAVRLLKRSKPPTHDSVSEQKRGEVSRPLVDHDGIELADIVKDPKLGALLQSYAREQGASEDLKLFTEFHDVLGVDSESLEMGFADELPSSEKDRLLRVSKSKFASSSDADQASMMSDAYNDASKRLMGDLLPRFCESDGFKQWVAQQHEDEKAELRLVAFLQSAPGLQAMTLQVKATEEELVLSTALRIESLLLTSSKEAPKLKLAQELVHTHFSPAAQRGTPLVDTQLDDALLAALAAWEANPEERKNALGVFQRVLIEGLHARLQEPLNKIIVREGIGSLMSTLVQHEHTKTNLVHWVHLPPAFDALRSWMTERRAAENLDFVADAIRFKALEDVSITKESASRIYSKFIATGAVAEICLPSDMASHIQEGLLPRFPSSNLYDEAVEHVIKFIQQDMWDTFRESSAFASKEAAVRAALLINDATPMVLSARWAGGLIRHAIVLSKQYVSIGSSNCDVCIPEAGGVYTTVMHVDVVPDGSGLKVSMLWQAAPRRVPSRMRRSASLSDSVRERPSSLVIARNTPATVKFGEGFIIGDFEAMILKM